MKKFRAPFLSEEKYRKIDPYIPKGKGDLFTLILIGSLLFVLILLFFAKFLFGLALGLLIGIPFGAIVYEYVKQNKNSDLNHHHKNQEDKNDKKDINDKKDKNENKEEK